VNTILNNSNSSITLSPDHELGIMIEKIEFSIPMNLASTASGYLTASGSLGSSYTFANNISPNLRFQPDEVVYLTGTNLINDEFNCNVSWIQVGDQTGYMECNTGRPNVQMYIPARLRDR
jgi:hypothetical protein